MTANQQVQGKATMHGGRMRRHQRLMLVSGLVATAVVGLLVLFTLLYFPRAGAEQLTQGDGLLNERGALREQLGVTVAPVNQAQLDALVRDQAMLRERLDISVAPVDQGQIDALVREHTGREQLGVTVAPVNQAQIDALVREHGGNRR